jgi:hypothetical protein
MRNAELLDVTVMVSPIGTPVRSSIAGTPISTPGMNPLTPFHVAGEETEPEQSETEPRSDDDAAADQQVAVTPVRRSLRLNHKSTTPMAKMNTPFPFGNRNRIYAREPRPAEPEPEQKNDDDEEHAAEEDKPEEVREEEKEEDAQPATADAVPQAVTPLKGLRVNAKETTPMAKMNTPFPFAKNRFPAAAAGNKKPTVVVLANPHLAPSNDN